MKNKVMQLIEAELERAENKLLCTKGLIARSSRAQITRARYGFRGKSLLEVQQRDKDYRDELVEMKKWFVSVMKGLE